MKRAIVLSGGGSKGAYQIGVWKALRILNIKYDIVTGTSVGALNAALMTQNTYYRGLNMWKHLEFKDVIDEKIENDINTFNGKRSILKAYAKNIVLGGMNVTNLEHTLDKNLKIKKLYRSKIDMGIVTVKAKKLEPMLLTKKQIKPSQLRDYLIASASCFPAFKKKEIQGKEYIDGGMFDNLPINLAIDMGATEIIAVDLKEVGLKREIKDKTIPITMISPRNSMGSFLIFNSKYSIRAIKLGFNDTMKEFKKLDGNKYTFKKNDLEKNRLKYVSELSNEKYIKSLESLGYLLDIDDSNIYTIKEYNKLLIKKFDKLKNDIGIKKLLEKKQIKKLFSNKFMVKYIYDMIINSDKELKTISGIFSDEYNSAYYLYKIKGVK